VWREEAVLSCRIRPPSSPVTGATTRQRQRVLTSSYLPPSRCSYYFGASEADSPQCVGTILEGVRLRALA